MIRIVFLFSLLMGPMMQTSWADEEADLAKLQQEISKLQQWLKETESEHDKLSEALQKSDEKIGAIAKKIDETRTKLNQERTRLKKLQAEQSQPGAEIVTPDRQMYALDAVLMTIEPARLDLSDDVLALLTPGISNYTLADSDREQFERVAGPAFDVSSAADTAAALTFDVLLAPERVARLIEFHRRDPANPGADAVLKQFAEGPELKRVGLRPEGRAPMREGVELFAAESGGNRIGRITSGGFGPTVGGPVAMGYVPADMTAPGTTVYGELRGKRLPVTVAELPFVPANFKR